MIVFRIFGYLFALAGLGFLIVDGARSIAAGAVELTPLGETWFKLDPPSINLAQAVIERYTLPFLWDPLIVTLLQWPTFAVGLGLGLIFILIGRRRSR